MLPQVTYGMHVVLRYEIERALIKGELKVDEVSRQPCWHLSPRAMIVKQLRWHRSEAARAHGCN
jgi:hypothetical protein